ncbi:MAG: histidine kinase, partial [Bacteroidota bacterium]
SWIWFLWYFLITAALGLLLFRFYQDVQQIRTYQIDPEVNGNFAGSDWVTWENTEKGVIATHVHPLPGYKPYDPRERIQVGDRLVSLDFNDITQAEVIDRITWAARPGKAFVAKIKRVDRFTQIPQDEVLSFLNGFYLHFSFNDKAYYWHINGWLLGVGTSASLVTLVILLPIFRRDWRTFLSTLILVSTALVFFLTQLLRHVYLIVESNLERVGAEKMFLMVYMTLLFAYIITYYSFRSGPKRLWSIIPSVLGAGFLLYMAYDIIYVERELKYFHLLIQRTTLSFFLLHLMGTLGFQLMRHPISKFKRGQWGLVAILLVGLACLVYYQLPSLESLLHPEHVLVLTMLLLFFPLGNATFQQLQFGKVSLVVNQTLQYLVAFVVSLVIYLLVSQLFEYIRPNIPYRRLLEFISFLIVLAIVRLVYLANENKLNRYFVSAQRERLSQFKNFIASIPRYTNSERLHEDMIKQLREFFDAEDVRLWWKGETPETQAEKRYHEKQTRTYETLVDQNTVWSKTKEISPLRLEPELEQMVKKSPYTLMAPITVDEDHNALLMLGKKKRGVYNLSDLELLSQLIQQTQLTLNVLELITREKDLIQQTYEANLTALRSQINPHFLFNTLNSIGELVHESADLAEEAIGKLAYIFRYTLDKSSENFVSLGDEMKLIRTYLDLEKIRFGDRLNVTLEVGDRTKEIQIPAFIVSTLVENTIKHGISKILHDGQVTVRSFREEEYLTCEVIDNGPGIDLTRIYKSHGLSNSISRLENIYDQKNLLYFENTGNGTYVRLQIPLGEKVAKP